MKKRIRSVHPLPLALTWIPVFAVFGLVVSLYNILTLGSRALITLLAVVAYPILGSIALSIGALIYNLAARFTGGVLIELSDEA